LHFVLCNAVDSTNLVQRPMTSSSTVLTRIGSIACAFGFLLCGACGEQTLQQTVIVDRLGDGSPSEGAPSEERDAGTPTDVSSGPDDGRSADAAVSEVADAETTPHCGAVDAGDATPHRIFVTSSSYTGDLVGAANALVLAGNVLSPDGGTFGSAQGISAADALCQYHAELGRLRGRFRAMFHGEADFFDSLTDDDGPWALPDGTPVANKVAELRSGAIAVVVDRTERCEVRPKELADGTAPVWTGSGYSTIKQPATCQGWSSDSEALPDGGVNAGSAGDYHAVGVIWSYAHGFRCSVRLPMTCIEVGPGAGPNHYPPIDARTKLAFVAPGFYPGDFVGKATTESGGSDSGSDKVHAVADEKCAEDARLAGLEGTFRAWVASSTLSANAYFQNHGMNGPWSRLDGMLVAQGLEQLGQRIGLAAPLNITAQGIVKTAPDEVWTGFVMDGAPAMNCEDFATTNVDLSGQQGTDSYNDYRWFEYLTRGCHDIGAGLYCFQE
jgi:hypothetical protein